MSYSPLTIKFFFHSHLHVLQIPFTHTPPPPPPSPFTDPLHSLFFPLSLIPHAPYWPNPTHSHYLSQYLSLSLSSTADKAKLSLKDVGLQDCDFKTGELWGFVGYKKRDEGVAVGFLQGFDTVELDTELNLGWNFKSRHQLMKYCICCEVNSAWAANTHLQNLYRRFYIHVPSMQSIWTHGWQFCCFQWSICYLLST